MIISEYDGKVAFENVIEGVTYRDEFDEQTGFREIVITESRDKTKNPVIKILNKQGEEQKQYNLPVGAHIVVKENASVKAGEILIKIPRAVGKAGDITGGLPRVTELFEARNPSNPAVVSEIDGEVSFGKIKRGNREIVITSKLGDCLLYTSGRHVLQYGQGACEADQRVPQGESEAGAEGRLRRAVRISGRGRPRGTGQHQVPRGAYRRYRRSASVSCLSLIHIGRDCVAIRAGNVDKMLQF